jgi:hypothetical protein
MCRVFLALGHIRKGESEDYGNRFRADIAEQSKYKVFIPGNPPKS